MPKRTLAPATLIILWLSCAFISANEPMDKIIALLDRYNQNFPQEKVHLQTDRNGYLAGDTIYFKAYVVQTAPNIPSDSSKILYIDLTNDAGHRSTFSYPLNSSVGSGSIELPDSLKSGTYTITAYTGWMRNFDQNFFFHAILTIGGRGALNVNADKAPSASKVTGHDLQFFPEGGKMVEQQTSVIGFKMKDSNGKGEDVSGTVVDENGNTVATFKASFAGIGRFSIKPMAGHHYQALFKTTNGEVKKLPLPVAAASGYVLSVENQNKKEILVTVKHSGLQQVAGKLSLVAQSGNKVISLTEVALSNDAALIKLDRQDFPNGIAQLTLFDQLSQPIAERLIFVNKQDQLQLRLSGPVKVNPQGGQQMTLEVTDELSNPVSGNFSVSITEQIKPTSKGLTLAKNDGEKSPSMMAGLLLTSDLQGEIEEPDYYFENNQPKRALLLDNLMLTQKWRRFIWKDLILGKDPKIVYPAEQAQTLRGTIRSSNGQPLSNGKVLLVSQGDAAYTMNETTDVKGRFIFKLPFTMGVQPVKLIASTAAGGTDVSIVLDEQAQLNGAGLAASQFSSIASVNRSQVNGEKSPLNKQQSVTSQGRSLKEVEIKAKEITLKEKALQASANLNGAGNADQVLTYKDLNNCSNLEQCLHGKLTGVFFKAIRDPSTKTYKNVPFASGGMGKPMLIVLDGIPMQTNLTSLSSIPAVDVQTIEVLRTGAKLVVYGMIGSGGILVITTKRGGIDYDQIKDPNKSTQASNLLSLDFNGYHKSSEFHKPVSDNSNSVKKGGSETILWNPAIHTNEDGKAVISFIPGFDTNKISVVIEGISPEGKIGYLDQQLNLK